MLLTGEVGTNLSELGLNAVVAQARVGAARRRVPTRCVACTARWGGGGGFRRGGVRDAGRAGRGGLHRRVVRTRRVSGGAVRRDVRGVRRRRARGEGKDVLLVLDDFTGLVGFSRDMRA